MSLITGSRILLDAIRLAASGRSLAGQPSDVKAVQRWRIETVPQVTRHEVVRDDWSQPWFSSDRRRLALIFRILSALEAQALTLPVIPGVSEPVFSRKEHRR